MDEPRLLPMLDAPAAERADAARNRELLLVAARDLVASCGAAAVTMEAVAERAGVGKGTVFRRFGSREGLMAALLDFSERAWQDAVMRGPAPLGPGAPPRDRLLAFGRSRVETTLTYAGLIRAAGSRPSAPRSFAVLHVRHLLGQLGVTGDVLYLASALMAPLDVDVLLTQTEVEHLSVDRIVTGWTDLARRIVDG